MTRDGTVGKLRFRPRCRGSVIVGNGVLIRIFMRVPPKPFRSMNITFNELRKIKDSLPDGSIHRIASELDLNVETVWNYFGGYNHPDGKPMGVHLEEGPNGGVVALDDTRILDRARQILGEPA